MPCAIVNHISSGLIVIGTCQLYADMTHSINGCARHEDTRWFASFMYKHSYFSFNGSFAGLKTFVDIVSHSFIVTIVDFYQKNVFICLTTYIRLCIDIINMRHVLNRPLCHRFFVRPVRLRVLSTKASILESVNQLANDMHIVSKEVILFTMFYCSMNWWYYRRMREDMDKKKEVNSNMDKDALMQSLCQTSVLLLKMGVNQSSMFSALKKALRQETSKSPKIKILYNDCYGSFLLTDHFVAFAYSKQKESKHNTIHLHPERIFPSPHISSYGQQVAAMYPWVVCAIYNYVYYKLEEVFKHIHYLRKESTKNEDIINFISKEYGFSHNITELMIDSVQNRISNDGTPMNFLDAVNTYSQYNTCIWCYDNNRFDHTAMKFIYNRLSYLETSIPKKHMVVANTDIMNEDVDIRSELVTVDIESVYVELGLLCAAGPGCRLQIAEVPSLLEWKISEYDGLETIDIQ